ncbi:hypothetical protein RVS70_07495 [Virgibacillus sp. M23]|uniref:hypothetical protein n=1 Tax=Virgibacillus sp. M23 TaxID=3079030 RepID=UPI002A91B041|nr:hypothetical protein [Virgibacillus sp. M23]MDY7044049.1 hypothetical protein [Virgibacillus sp. M23]
MADKKSREGKVIWECVECGHEHDFHQDDYRQDGLRCKCCGGLVIRKSYQDKHKLSEEAFKIREKIVDRKINYCRNLTPKQVDTVIELYKENKEGTRRPVEGNGPRIGDTPPKKSVGTLEVDIDYSNTIKGLKAIQREAKKTTASLKELEEQRKRNIFLTIELDDEDSTLPRVFHEGKEITNKVRVHFDWKTRTDQPGKLEVNVEYYKLDDQVEPRITGIGIERLT